MKLSKCTYCELSKTRINVVKGRGNKSNPLIMFVGEAPGKNEDERGIPFCGKAGSVLDNIIYKLGLKDNDYYITNLVKCRPPKNRDPKPSEKEKCFGWLKKQLKVIEPQIIVSLGKHSGDYLSSRYNLSPWGKDNEYIFIHHSNPNISPLFKMVHPAAILYDNKLNSLLDLQIDNLKIFIEVIKLIKKLSRGGA